MDNRVQMMINGLLGSEAILASFIGLFIIIFVLLIRQPVVGEYAL